MNVSQLSLDSNILSLGAMLGTSGSQDLINNINSRCGGGSFFSEIADPFRQGFQNFMTQIVEPIRKVETALHSTAKALFCKDVYRPITSIKDLEKGVPPCMFSSIVYHAPVRKLLEEERIDGWGIKADDLEEGDIYANVLENGHVRFDSSTLDKNGEITIHFKESTEDPEVTYEDVQAIRATREFLDEFMSDEITSAIDPTAYPNLHA